MLLAINMRSVLPGCQLGWHRAHLQPRQQTCGAEEGGQWWGGRAQPQSPQSGAPRSGRCSRGSSRPQPNLGTAPELSRAGRAPPMARLSGQPAGTMEHSCCCWVLNVTKGYRWAWGGEGARVRDHSGGSGSVGGAVPVTPLHPQAPAACVHPSAHNKPPPLRGLPRAWHWMSRKSVLKRPLSSHCA